MPSASATDEKVRLRKRRVRQMEEIPKPRLPEQKTDRKLPRPRAEEVEGVALDTQLRERESSPMLRPMR